MLFTPTVDEMYPAGARTTVHVDGLTERLCAARAARATSTASPPSSPSCSRSSARARAYFGRKDAQQLAVDPPHGRRPRPAGRRRRLPARARARRPRAVEPQRVPRRRRPPAPRPSSRGALLPGVGGGRRAASATPPRVRQLVVDTVAHAPQVRARLRRGRRRRDARAGRARSTADTLVALAAFVGKARLIDNVTITFAAGVPTPDLGVLTASSGMQEADH